jgi:hypothetical protein
MLKARYLYILLFALPGLVLSGILSFLLSGMTLGILWLFVFGDNPWPAAVESLLPVVFLATFLLAWLACLLGGYYVGKRLEADGGAKKSHILISLGLTALMIVFILLQQWGAGNLGPKTEGQLCHEFCVSQGYSASSTPPRNSGQATCGCLDDTGREALTVPLEGLQPQK